MNIRLQARDIAADKGHLFMLFELLAPLLRHLIQTGIQTLQILKVGQQLGRAFRANPRDPRYF